MADTKREARLPMTGVIGVGLVVVGVLAMANGGNAVILMFGVVLLIVGVVQKSSRQRQRQHDELMAEMRRQRGETPTVE